MYFTRKKTTVNATVFHLDNMNQKEKHDHLTEVFKMAHDSLNSVNIATSTSPIHFIIPVIYPSKVCDELIFAAYRNSLLSDILGVYSFNSGTPLFPKVVVDKLFSPEVSSFLKNNIIEKRSKANSIFTREFKENTILPLNYSYAADLPLEDSETISRRISGSYPKQSLFNNYVKKYALSNQKTGKEETDENQIINRLLPKSKVSSNNSYPNTLITVDYTLSLSELGEFAITLMKTYKRRDRYDRSSDLIDSYGSVFINLAYDINHGNFTNRLCERLGIKDKRVISNLNNYILKNASSSYDDFIKETYDFNMNKESLIEDIEEITNISNTFIPVTFLFYLQVNPSLFNKPESITKYAFSLTRPSCLQGRVSFTERVSIQDNYKSDTYTTTIVTTILPVNFTSLVLKSKMSDLKEKQKFMEVPEVGLLSTQYNLIYNTSFKEDFIFYDDEKATKIIQFLNSCINVRFDKNIQVSCFTHFPSQYPLSLTTYKDFLAQTYNLHFKETLFDYLGIDIDYNKPIQTSINKIKKLFESFDVLGSLIPKDLENYLYTWLIVLYIQNNVLFIYNHPNLKKKIVNWYNENLNFINELNGGWRSDFFHEEWSSYRNYSYVIQIYPMLLDIVYKMVSNSTPEEVLISLKNNILPIFEANTKTLINSISNLYKTKETVISWEKEKDPEIRKKLLNDECSKTSVFNKIDHTVYNQFNVNLSHIVKKGIYNKNYEDLLVHVLTYIKVFHYFVSMRSCFKVFIRSSEPEKLIQQNFKSLTTEYKGDNLHVGALFELNQIMTQFRSKNKTKGTETYSSEELYKWYEAVHLNFLFETF